jgi:hypothetical protein
MSNKIIQSAKSNAGKARTAILLWLLGVPVSVIALIYLLKGCV